MGCRPPHSRLHGLAYPSLEDPTDLVPAARALSATCAKLAQAIEASRDAPQLYNDYISALKAVLPTDHRREIRARPGRRIPATRRRAIRAGNLWRAIGRREHLGGRWVVEVTSWMRADPLETWGMEGQRPRRRQALLEAPAIPARSWSTTTTVHQHRGHLRRAGQVHQNR